MKRLLIFFILLPVISSARQQGRNAIDSNRDVAANLQSMAASMANDQCTRVAEIRISDNGGYSTVVVFFHGITEADTAIKEDIKTDTPVNQVIAEVDTPVSKVIAEVDTPVNKVIAEVDTPVSKEDIVPVPPGPGEITMAVDSMHLSPNGYSLLQKLEGYSPELYNLGDGGYTIGFGFFVPYNESNKWKNGITWDGAETLMKQKVPAYEAQVKEYVNVPITQKEFDALTMLAYNLGGFSKATSIINDINNQVDFDVLQRDWKRFVHSKARNVTKGLMNRRKDELGVRKVSDYQPDRKIQVFKK